MDAVKQTDLRETNMKKKKKEDEKPMRDEYDFSKGVRGKHYKAYREGHTAIINKDDGTQSIQYFKEEEIVNDRSLLEIKESFAADVKKDEPIQIGIVQFDTT